MNASLPGRIVINKLYHFIGMMTRHRENSSPIMDTLHQEIYHIEQTLVKRSRQSSSSSLDTRPLEPITEQQKIIDLAG